MTKKLELQLTNDYIFKRLFSKKGNEDILKDLLEGILEIPIKEVEVMQEVELERVDIKDKLGVLDIKAIINENITVDIEMQIVDEKNMIERTLYYWAGLYYTGLKRGRDYKLNNKVITINIFTVIFSFIIAFISNTPNLSFISTLSSSTSCITSTSFIGISSIPSSKSFNMSSFPFLLNNLLNM